MTYTRNTRNCAEPLFEQDDSLNVNFNASKRTVWLIHGYRPIGSVPSWLQNFVRVLLNQDDMNIVVVDWNQGATTFIYNRAIKNARKVAVSLSEYIRRLLVSLECYVFMCVVQSTVCYATLQSVNNFLKFLFVELGRERERERNKQTSICCSTYLCIHWLILVRALIGN